MEQIRIDARDLRLRARHRRGRDAAAAEASAPLAYATPDGADVDEDLLARIDSLLGSHRREDEDTA